MGKIHECIQQTQLYCGWNQFAQKYGQISQGYVANIAIQRFERFCTKVWAKFMRVCSEYVWMHFAQKNGQISWEYVVNIAIQCIELFCTKNGQKFWMYTKKHNYVYCVLNQFAQKYGQISWGYTCECGYLVF